jgi:Holliday junction resolvase
MTNYQKGRNYEYKIQHQFERAGHIVTRSAGSHGLFDLVTLDLATSEVWFIQAKDRHLSPHELKLLVDEVEEAIPEEILHNPNYRFAIVNKEGREDLWTHIS